MVKHLVRFHICELMDLPTMGNAAPWCTENLLFITFTTSWNAKISAKINANTEIILEIIPSHPITKPANSIRKQHKNLLNVNITWQILSKYWTTDSDKKDLQWLISAEFIETFKIYSKHFFYFILIVLKKEKQI